MKLNVKIENALKKHGILQPTEIQFKTFPSASNGHDVIGISQTGSGKTLAFLLPMIQQILLSDKPFHVLILVPTRELGLQIFNTLNIFSDLSIRYTFLSGGEDFNQEVMDINKKPHIVIGTPGRVSKHILKTKNFYCDRFRKLIFDEADRFFEQDFSKDLDLISKKLTKKNQTLMFTATLTERCNNLAHLFMRTPRIYNQENSSNVISSLRESFTFIPEKYRVTVLYNYLNERKNLSCIVFTGLCTTAQKIGLTLQQLGLSCEYLHGKMQQLRRVEIIKSFREKEFNVLVCTDVASRGLDIPHVEVVINFDLPENSKTYTHRVGRTARAGKEGQALTLVSQYDVEKFQKLEKILNRTIEDIKYRVYSNYERVKEVFEEVNTEFNQDKSFKV